MYLVLNDKKLSIKELAVQNPRSTRTKFQRQAEPVFHKKLLSTFNRLQKASNWTHLQCAWQVPLLFTKTLLKLRNSAAENS